MDGLDRAILACAEALDLRDHALALDRLRELPPAPVPAPRAKRLHILSLWRRSLVFSAATTTGQHAAIRVTRFLVALRSGVQTGDLRLVLHAVADAGQAIDPADLAALVVSVLPETLTAAQQAERIDAVALVLPGGDNARNVEVWRLALCGSPDLVPTLWHYLTLGKAAAESGSDPDRLATDAGRADLLPLFSIYRDLLAARPLDPILARAAALATPQMRQRVAEYLRTAPTTRGRMALAADALPDLAADAPDDPQALLFQTRVAAMEGRWSEIVEATDRRRDLTRDSPDLVCMRALALARLDRAAEADEALDFLRGSPDCPCYVRGRAALVQMGATLARAGLPQPDARALPDWPVRAGRPLAQSLWVGPRLRWIEELSIASFLRNGWRYQLYVYDIPENVPQGVELLDAQAILPRARVFAEGAASQGHVGSLGAFSDLFRYAMLDERGGMWTDTDVINLRRFEPEGRRFVATEHTDVAFVGPNGAMMAAPAGDPFLRAARARAEEIIARGEVQFSSIGPDLLADLVGRQGFEAIDLMPPDFLNPVAWMETGILAGPPGPVARRLRETGAPNLHVYTETWRQFGLDLARPPGRDSFLGALHAGLCGSGAGTAATVPDLLDRIADTVPA